MKLTFEQWLSLPHKNLNEWKDIFGFDKEMRPQKKDLSNYKPINQVDIEQIMQYLEMHDIGELKPNVKFINEIHWGIGPGALRCLIGTGLNVIMERRGIDLLGVECWSTKKVLQIDQSGYGGYEDAIANEVFQKMEQIHKSQIDSPKSEYPQLESLVASMASTIRKVGRDIFVYEGIRKINENNYIIRLGIRGHGVEAPNQRRVEENQTQVSFNPETGVIRMVNYNIESDVGSHSWEIMQADSDWKFFPTQSKDEIVETIANTLHWY